MITESALLSSEFLCECLKRHPSGRMEITFSRLIQLTKRMICLLVLIHFTACQSGANPNTILLNRLMGSYRIDFDDSDASCNLTEWDISDKNINNFNSTCLKYVTDDGAAYSPYVRPVLDASNPIQVTFGMTVAFLIGINEKEQYMESAVTLRYAWFDEFLKWKPDMNNGIELISIPYDQVWRPDFVTYNDLSPNGMNIFASNVNVRYDGLCMWLPPAKLKTACDVDMKLFPFDQQTCWIKIGSWTHSKQQIDVKLMHPSNENGTEGNVVLSGAMYTPSSEWNLTSSKAVLNEVKYDCCPESYQDVTIYFTQKRFSYQPVLTLLVPCIVTAFLLLLVFFLPPDAGEKVGLSKFNFTEKYINLKN